MPILEVKSPSLPTGTPSPLSKHNRPAPQEIIALIQQHLGDYSPVRHTQTAFSDLFFTDTKVYKVRGLRPPTLHTGVSFSSQQRLTDVEYVRHLAFGDRSPGADLWHLPWGQRMVSTLVLNRLAPINPSSMTLDELTNLARSVFRRLPDGVARRGTLQYPSLPKDRIEGTSYVSEIQAFHECLPARPAVVRALHGDLTYTNLLEYDGCIYFCDMSTVTAMYETSVTSEMACLISSLSEVISFKLPDLVELYKSTPQDESPIAFLGIFCLRQIGGIVLKTFVGESKDKIALRSEILEYVRKRRQ